MKRLLKPDIFILKALIFFVLIAVFTPIAKLDDFYVNARHGSDETGDGSEENPWKRLQFAIDTIEGTEETPHTIHLAPGIYGPQESGDDRSIVCNDYESIVGNSELTPYIYALITSSIVDRVTASHFKIENVSLSFIGSSYGSKNVNLKNIFMRSVDISNIVIANESELEFSNINIYKSEAAINLASDSSAIFKNSIFREYLYSFDVDESCYLEITYSNVGRGYPGEGNIDANPRFVDPENGDFRLRQDSPCIDAGDPSDPVPPGGGGRIDMGCFEYDFEPVLYPLELSLVETSGDGDGIPELNETFSMNLKLTNAGESAGMIAASLTCSHGDVSITESLTSYPSLTTDDSAFAVIPFQWTVTDYSGWCLPVDFSLEWSCPQGSGTIGIPLNLHGDDVHIDPMAGSDETGMGSPENPFKTLDHTVRYARGSRWMPVMIRPHAGTYSPSTNGENYPVYLSRHESIQGDGMDLTHLDNDGADQTILYTGPQTSIYDLHFRSTCIDYVTLLDIKFSTGEMKRCRFDRELDIPNNNGFWVSGDSDYQISDCIVNARCGMSTYYFDQIIFENNYAYKLDQTSGQILNNHIGEGGLEFGYVSNQATTIAKNNLIERMSNDSGSGGVFVFEENICLCSLGCNPDAGSRITGNFFLGTDNYSGISVGGSPDATAITHNIVIHMDKRSTSYLVPDGSAYFSNNIAVGIKMNSNMDPTYAGLFGVFALDNSIGLFTQTDLTWSNSYWNNNNIVYYIEEDSSQCTRAYYNDLEGCPEATNMDVEPMFVGMGHITRVGPGFFQDDTACWEPDRYKGMYVNPAILTNDEPFYCWGNDEITLFVGGDPSLVAEEGDLFFIPDFRLRSTKDGFAFDSPLMDAGNPDPSWNDPDGSRCDLGVYGGPLASTPMPRIPTWPPPGPSPTPTPTPPVTMTETPTSEASPTPSPSPAIFQYILSLNMDLFGAGDPFTFTREIRNSLGVFDAAEIIVLDVYGEYFFHPAWDPGLHAEMITVPNGTDTLTILEFTWPEGDFGSAENLFFYGACLDPGTAEIIGNYDFVEFGYR